MPKKKPRRTPAPPGATSGSADGGLPIASWLPLFLLALAGGAAVRVLAADGELWLDELWSFRLVRTLTDPSGIVTSLHHDNNHHLNSLYLWFVSESPHWLYYRLHVLVAGVLTVLLAATVAWREGGRGPALAATILLSGSFLMVLYASEARGYAPALLFAFAAVILAARFLETGRIAWAAGYGVAAGLGILSHLTFLHALLGIIVWTAARVRQGKGPLRAMVALHVAPIAVLAILYWVDLRHMVVGGGPMLGAWDVVARVLSLSLGGPEGGPWLNSVALVAAAAAAASIVTVRRSGSDLWILFIVTAVVAPALTLAVVGSDLLFERYFFVAAGFLILSFGWLVAAAAQPSRVAAAALVILFLVPNAGRITRLIEEGRGSYLPAIHHVTALGTQRPVTVGSDHDFRNGRMVEFYRQFHPAGSTVEYHMQNEWAPAGPEWMFVHSQDYAFEPNPNLTVAGGRRYRLSAFYPSAGVSGWHLAVYHNALATGR